MAKRHYYRSVCRITWKDEGVDALDIMLLFLILGAYVILLWLGIPLWWALCVVIIFGLIYLGLRYPRGKEDFRSWFNVLRPAAPVSKFTAPAATPHAATGARA